MGFIFFRNVVLGSMLVGVLSQAHAQTCSKRSPAHTVALLELYTSEGCSSCPPADRHVSSLMSPSVGSGLGLDRVVPLSLHVDYWNDIGWKDRFSQSVFTQRQRWLSGLAASRTIYTPEIFVDGRELRGWGSGTAAAIKRVNARPAAAAITLTLGQASARSLPVQVAATSASNGNLFIALYENAISTDVKAGENRGVQLHHDYVVHHWIGPLPLKNGRIDATPTMSYPADAKSAKLGVAAFVQSDQGEILQALALPSCS